MYGLTRVANISWTIQLAALLLVSTALNCVAAPAITLAPHESVRTGTLSAQLDLLEDKDGQLTIESVSREPASTGFVAATPTTTNVGFSSSASERATSAQPGEPSPSKAAAGARMPPETGGLLARGPSMPATSCFRSPFPPTPNAPTT